MLIKCKTFGSYLYCYDKEKNIVYAYPRQEISFNQCPEKVISAFINDDYDAEIKIITKDEKQENRQ